MHLIYIFFFSSFCQEVLSKSEIFDIVPTGVDATQGRDVILRCSLKKEYEKLYTLSWLVNGEEVEGKPRYTSDNGKLHIDAVDKDLDSKPFQCLATSKSDPTDEYDSGAIMLNIKWTEAGAVLLRTPATDKEILPGVRIILKCNVTGNPKPRAEDIQWTRNGVDIEDPRFQRLADIQLKKDRLIIPQAELVVYDGKYACCVRNECSHPNYDLTVRDVFVPVLVTPPKDVIVLLSRDARFYCGFDATPPPVIKWTDSYDEPLSNRPKQTPGEECRVCVYPNGTVVIKRVKEKYAGKYTCTATGAKGNSTSASAQLKIAFINPFPDAEPEVEYIKPVRNVEKVCSAPDAIPKANITWMKNGVEIAKSDGKNSPRVTVSGNTLVITEARTTDEGDYICVAQNLAGNTTKTFTFLIANPPSMRSDLVARTEKEGEEVILKCDVDANAPVEYTWYKNSTIIKPDKRFKPIENVLKITSISVEDAAAYKCVARNPFGEATSVAWIRVKEQLKLMPELKNNICIEAGNRAEIPCAARGVINPTAEWTFVDGESDSYKIVKNGPGRSNETLVFMDPKPKQSWRFVCTAGGESGVTPKKRTITIAVGNKPTIKAVPETPTVYEEGNAVRLDCGISPVVLSKLKWLVDTSDSGMKKVFTLDTNDEGDQYTVMNNGSLYVKSAALSDSGNYSCTYNECGFRVQRNITLIVVDEVDGPLTTPMGPDGNDADDGTPEYQKIQTIALAVGGSVAYLILTITIIVYCRRKRHKKTKSDCGEVREDMGSDDEEKLMLNGSMKNSNGNSKKTNILMVPVTHLDDDIKNLQYDHCKLDKVTVIGHGDFGEVFLSKAPGLFPDLAEDILVMVKQLDPLLEKKEDNYSSNNSNGHVSDSSLIQTSKKSRRYEFNREIQLLHLADHVNVVRLLGVCSKSTASPTKPDHLITEYLEWGILKLCLQASREGKIKKFSKNLKMRMCCQIAAGLEHLTQLGIAHQDIATRNCVISSKMLIKLTVLGLTKEGFESEYGMYKGRRLPIRWLPPEAVFLNAYELKSDVWSFGVTCWEIFTLGTMPFSDLSDDQFLEELRSDNPPTLPPLDNSKRITSLITKCCHRSPVSRPEFHQIVRKLQSIVGSESTPAGKAEAAAGPNETDVDASGPLLTADDDIKSDRVHEVKT